MKKLIKINIIILSAALTLNTHAETSEENPDINRNEPAVSSKVLRDSALSPEKIEDFQNKDRGPVVMEDTTIKELYQNVNFLRLRSLETVFIIDSGTTEEKPHFDSVKGFGFGGNIEFPVVTNYFNGGSPIAKLRVGKTTIDVNDSDNLNGVQNVDAFADSLGSSELYMISAGGGYCYHTGFNCFYGLYNTSLTGQLTENNNNNLSAIPTKLKGFTMGVSSTFEVGLGFELTAGMEYSMMKHQIPTEEDHKFNTLGLVMAVGFIEESRHKSRRDIEFVRPNEI